MKHLKIFEDIQSKPTAGKREENTIDGIKIDNAISPEIKENLRKCINDIKSIKKSSDKFKISNIYQGWWDTINNKYSYSQNHEDYKVVIYFSLGLKDNWIDNGYYRSHYKKNEDSKEFLNEMSDILNEAKLYLNQLDKYDTSIDIDSDECFCRIYLKIDNTNKQSIINKKLKRILEKIDDFFSSPLNDHANKTISLYRNRSGELVSDYYLDIYEIICDLQSINNFEINEHTRFKLRFTYSSKIENNSIIIKFNPLKYRLDGSIIKKLIVDSTYGNMLNQEISKIIRRRISFIRELNEFNTTTKGDKIIFKYNEVD